VSLVYNESRANSLKRAAGSFGKKKKVWAIEALRKKLSRRQKAMRTISKGNSGRYAQLQRDVQVYKQRSNETLDGYGRLLSL
jgi:predicted  nucleic acid-binding Zn-ribbon protein